MPQVTFLPVQKSIEVGPDKTVLEAALEAGVDLDHACGGACALMSRP